MGKTFPEDTRALDGALFLKIFQEIHARHVIGNSSARSGKHGGEEIDGRYEFGALGGIKAAVRPGEHDGCANPALVGRLLGARRISVSFWILDPAIVGNVYDQGIVPEVSFLKNVDELSAGFVKPLTSGIILGNANGKALFLVPFEKALRRIMRSMGEKHAIPEKEGLFFRNGMVNEFFDRFHSFPTDLQAVVTMATAAFRKSPGHPMGESTVLVTSFPPFSALVAEITAFGEQLGQGVELVEIGNELGPALVVKFGTALGVLG